MIDEITIRNFKSFREQTIKLSPLTVFAGINGVGKSSCIQALLLLRQSFLLGRLNEHGGLVLDGEYTKPGNGRDVLYFGAETSESIDFELSFGDGKKCKFKFNCDKESDLQPSREIKHTDSLDSFQLFNNNFYYLNADRLSPDRDIFPASQSNIEKGNLGKHGQFSVHYISRNPRRPIGITDLKHPKAATENLLDNVEAWLGEITPGIHLTPQFYPEINSARLAYKFDIDGGVTDEFKPANVGYGITYILPIITQLLISKPGQIVVIENPESHLHPSGQSAIAKLCLSAANKGVQVIIETHSDHIINAIIIAIKRSADSAEESIDVGKVSVNFVDRKPGKLYSTSHLIIIEKDGRIADAPRNFFDQFAKDIKTIMGF